MLLFKSFILKRWDDRGSWTSYSLWGSADTFSMANSFENLYRGSHWIEGMTVSYEREGPDTKPNRECSYQESKKDPTVHSRPKNGETTKATVLLNILFDLTMHAYKGWRMLVLLTSRMATGIFEKEFGWRLIFAANCLD